MSPVRQQAFGQRPQLAMDRRLPGKPSMPNCRHNPLDVAVENRRPLPEGKGRHRRRRRAADTRQFGQFFGVGRKLPAMVRGNLLRAACRLRARA
jgi:hypothetical protein